MKMRILHRYLGFFLVGIMAIYAISGIVLIFRDTDFLKRTVVSVHEVPIGTKPEDVGQLLKIKGYRIDRSESDLVYFNKGTYELSTGKVTVISKKLPYVLDRMSHLHKATSSRPLFFLNIFFGASLLFFVLSAFWM